jgi:KamA family protein
MKYHAYTRRNFQKIPVIGKLSSREIQAIKIVSKVLPFKTNNYVIDELIDWDNHEEDPLFIINFPQESMLKPSQFKSLGNMLENKAPRTDLSKYVQEIRTTLNPHPAGQLEHNIPMHKGQKLTGVQHKYRETALFFPAQGQTCHAYCTFCFRWPQFTGQNELKFAMKQTDLLISYLKENPAISDLLITGGDPMTMKTGILKKYIEKILEAGLPGLKTIRIGTKSLTYWPYRYISDPDAGELLDLFRKVTDSGLHLAFMAHFNHYRELETDAVREAVRRIRKTGATIRTQSPLLRHVNDDAAVWSRMWRMQVNMGMVPYYMFIARDTGAQTYFGLTLEQAHHIFNEAYKQVSGVCRTVRGPSMSAGPGKVRIAGISEIRGEDVFILEFLQARNPDWVGNPFFATFDPEALWLDDLVPAFGDPEFFYEREYKRLLKIDKLPGHILTTENRQYA